MPVDKIKKQTRDTFDYKQDTSSGIVITRWNDNGVVTMTSNCHAVQPVGAAKRWSRKEKSALMFRSHMAKALLNDH